MTIDYIDGFEYHDGAFASYTHPQGRIAPGEQGVNCEYFLRDHLGSVRVIYADVDRDRGIDFDEEECELLEEFHYYPFGLEMTGMWNDMREDQYRNRNTYNGKQAQTEMGWDWINYGARFYDPMVGRFTGVDPLAELAPNWTQYRYGYNNPLRYTDPNGMLETDYYSQTGKYLGTDGNNNSKIVIVKDNKEAASISKTNRSGGLTPESSIKSGVTLPSQFVRSEMGKAVDNAGSPSFHEEGGFFGTASDGSGEYVVHAKPGPKIQLGTGDDASINVFQAADISTIKAGTIDGTFHTHPDGTKTIGNVTHHFENEPSGSKGYGDIPNAKTNAMGVTGNNFVLAQGNKTVYIYNGSGTIATFPFKQFFSAGIVPSPK